MRARRTPDAALYPRVDLGPRFARRLELFARRVAAARGAHEALGHALVRARGHEFLGFRPWNQHDDAREIDWTASARSTSALVRQTQAEAGERWLVWIDDSRSMAVGPPGKLECAAAIAAGLAACGLAQGARVELRALSRGATAGRSGARCVLEKRAQLAQLLDWLGGLRAEHELDAAACERALRTDTSNRRVFVLTDALEQSAALCFGGPARRARAQVFFVLARDELAPSELGPTQWWQPEVDTRLTLSVDAPTRARYARALEIELARWRRAAQHARGGVHVGLSSQSFETWLAPLVRALAAERSAGAGAAWS